MQIGIHTKSPSLIHVPLPDQVICKEPGPRSTRVLLERSLSGIAVGFYMYDFLNFSVFEQFLPQCLGEKKEEEKKVTDVDIVQWRQQITVPFSILSIVLRFSTCVQCNERQGGTVERMLFIDACPGCASTPAPSSSTASLDSS